MRDPAEAWRRCDGCGGTECIEGCTADQPRDEHSDEIEEVETTMCDTLTMRDSLLDLVGHVTEMKEVMAHREVASIDSELRLLAHDAMRVTIEALGEAAKPSPYTHALIVRVLGAQLPVVYLLRLEAVGAR